MVWLRTWVVIPRFLNGYDLTGSRIWMQSWKDADVAVYFNGQRVAAGEDLDPVVLFASAKPGDRALVAVRIARTDDPKWLPETVLKCDPAPGRPSPREMYTEFVSAALLIPHLANDVPASYSVLEKAIGDVDLQALQRNNQQKFDEMLRASQRDLAPIQTTVRQSTFYLAGNSHIDSAWLWPWTETVEVVKRTFQSALQLMAEYPRFTYTQSAAQYNEWIAEKYPSINAEIKQRVKEGRWELVGGMWVEPDLNMPNGESLVRQLLIGQRLWQKLYGVTAKVGWNPDSFGYNWQLPQIYKKSGIDYFVTQKLSWNEVNPLPLKLFWWQSPDGSKVLSYFPHSYGNEDLSPIRLSNDLVKARRQVPGMTELMDLYGVGDHGGGPTRAIVDQGVSWMQPDKIIPTMKFASAKTYFNDIEKKVSANSPTWNYETVAQGVGAFPTPGPGEVMIPTWNDELYLEHHRGTYTTQARQKQNLRNSEVWMLDAEKYASLAWLYGEPYPTAALNEAWKKTLFNQSHDLAAGSGIGVIYREAEHDYDQVHWSTNEVSSKALHAIQARVNTSGAGVPVLVFNPLAWPRSGLVQVDVQMPTWVSGVTVLDAKKVVLPSEILSRDRQTNTYHLLIQARGVPSLGYEVLHLVPGKRHFASDLRTTGMTIENSALRVVVDPHNGCIMSIYQKAKHFEALAPGTCGNQLQMFNDTPKADDAWNIDFGTLDHFTPLLQADSVTMEQQGPVRAIIRVARKWHSSTIVQHIMLTAGSDQVEVANEIDWHETHILMKAAFTLAASDKSATYEIPFGTIKRPTTRDNSWEQAQFEVPALQWADLSNRHAGVSLVNESKYGYDCAGNVLRLTLLRSPVEPDPEADRGHHRFSYSLYPHLDDWKTALTVRRGYEYNNKLKALQVHSHSGSLPPEYSFFDLQSSNLVLTAVKKAEDAEGLILRFYEYQGKNSSARIRVPAGARSARLTNLMEEPTGEPLSIARSGGITVPVHPYEIVSIRIDYPRSELREPSKR
ncbi:MAG: alpha-mannosidase [Terriglobales bacterium]